jgi:hypothetical protein
MTINHALLFINNGPRQGKEPQALELYESTRAFWNKRKQAGQIDNYLLFTLRSRRSVDHGDLRLLEGRRSSNGLERSCSAERRERRVTVLRGDSRFAGEALG